MEKIEVSFFVNTLKAYRILIKGNFPSVGVFLPPPLMVN